MGGGQSHPSVTEDLLEDYTTLTYLSKGEILYLMKKFKSIDPDKVLADYQHRFSRDKIIQKFDVLRNNPFQDRIFRVFSSKRDDSFSFEDLLDLCSAMSADCPPDVRATWAFRIYDLDEDNQITERDICEIIDRLLDTKKNDQNKLDDESKKKISKNILDEIKLDHSDGISLGEFKYILARFPEFETSFYFRM
ncbi:calcium and integrin-binding protein 1-like [Plodia interpunctella]|uniref:calcium and integrin-binding protein 1-like n=1 Tax=Plodia interpunctella TaxID=58824 RepID=UPI002367C3F2|nr:calcium and integrin-binding protein 1-like [Plodia interpunctella]